MPELEKTPTTEEKSTEVAPVSQEDFDALKTQMLEQTNTISKLTGTIEGMGKVPPQTVAQPAPVGPPPKTKEQLNQDFTVDPAGATMSILDSFTATKLAPIVQESLGNAAASNLREAKRTHSEMFEKYGDEIVALAGTVDSGLLAKPEAYDYIVNQIRAKHIDEIVSTKVQSETERIEAEKNPPPTPKDVSLSAGERPALIRDPERTPEEQLSAEELEICAKQGITAEDYIKYSDPELDLVSVEGEQ